MDNAYHRMSSERSLEEELNAARTNLRRQTIRCHQIISALMRKMQEKETEAQTEKQLRDRQLSGVLRSLYNLEARLRREQRAIRQQLVEKDSLIAEQQKEIEELKKAAASASHRISVQSQTTLPDKSDAISIESAADAPDGKKMIESKPDLITSIIDTSPSKNEFNNDQQLRKHRVTFDTDCTYFSNDWSMSNMSSDNILDNFDAYEFNQNSLESFGNDASSSKNSDSDGDYKIEINSFDLISSNVENSFNDSGQSLDSQDRTIVQNSQPATPEPPAAYKISQPPSTLIQEIKIGSENDRNNEYYQNNPVLKCVNQILLRDEEDYLEEQRNLQLREEQRQNLSQDVLKMSPAPDRTGHSPDRTSLTFEPPSPFKTSPTFKTQKDEEKFFYPLQSKLFTPPKIMSNCKNSNSKTLPPALPPKPQCLLKSKPKISFNNSISTNPFITPPDPEAKQKLAQPIRIENNERMNSVLQAINNNNADSPFPKPPSPNDELYVISNSALSGHDDDDDLMTSQTSLFNSHQSGLTDQGNITNLQNCLNFSPSQFCADQILLSNLKNNNENKSNDLLNLLPNNVYHMSNGNEIKDDTPSSVSQMVKKFENITKPSSKVKDSSNESLSKESFDLSQNFEEFCLEDCDIESVDSNKSTSDSSRISAEGAEVAVSAPPEDSGASYENFLEATGLSQKSIMTPSRMFSNHKHVLKPKDVKHRNKVKATSNVGIFQRCAAATSINGGPTIKYWTEPFL